jgi:carbon storage regulator
MLVLSRKPGEEIVVPGCDLVFTILEVRGDKVRLGISAPTEVHIYRREIWERIQAGAARNGNHAAPVGHDHFLEPAVKNGVGHHS